MSVALVLVLAFVIPADLKVLETVGDPEGGVELARLDHSLADFALQHSVQADALLAAEVYGRHAVEGLE